MPAKEFISFMLLLVYVMAGPFFKKIKFSLLHESGLVMLLGLLVSVLAYVANGDSSCIAIEFDEATLFNIILPPIIFSAGYNMKKRNFAKNTHYILITGIISTFTSFFTVTACTLFLNSQEMFHFSNGNQEKIDFKTGDIILFSAVICATDSVAALTFISEEGEPKLYSILFGEGVMNDAVCIVLFGILSKFDFENEGVNAGVVWNIFSEFGSVLVLSILLGALVGVIGCLVLKYMKSLNPHTEAEIITVLVFAILSYSVGEMMHMSPIVALLITGIVLSQYGYYNLSYQGSQESQTNTKLIAHLAEAFIFIAVGLSSIYLAEQAFSWSFFGWQLLIVFLSRGVAIFVILNLTSLFSCGRVKVSLSDQIIMFTAGCVKGAIAFGLSTTMNVKNNRIKQVILTTTMALVFVTTIVLGGILPFIIRLAKGKKEVGTSHSDISFRHQSNLFYYEQEVLASGDTSSEEDSPGCFYQVWRIIDTSFLRRHLVYDWDAAAYEHTELTKRLNKTVKEFKADSLGREEPIDEGLIQ